MRVDLTSTAASQISTEPSTKRVGAGSTASASVSSSEDRTTLTSDSTSLTSLVGTAMKSPEVREDKVASLKHAIETGQYKLNPSAIASSMIDEHA